jgi:hypothetical protein
MFREEGERETDFMVSECVERVVVVVEEGVVVVAASCVHICFTVHHIYSLTPPAQAPPLIPNKNQKKVSAHSQRPITPLGCAHTKQSKVELLHHAEKRLIQATGTLSL